MLEIAIASGEAFGEADALLIASLHDGGNGLRMAAMSPIRAVDHRAMVRPERQQGTDGLHAPSIARPSTHERRGLLNEISRRRPIFPGGCPPSIFGAGELNFRVRDGNGWGLFASVTGIHLQLSDRFARGEHRSEPCLEALISSRRRPSVGGFPRAPAAC